MKKDSLKRKGDVLKTQLRALKAKNRKQAKKLRDLKGKMAESALCEGEGVMQREQIDELTRQVMYMEAFCNDARAEVIQTQEELVSAHSKLLQHSERDQISRERLVMLEKNLQASTTERFLSRKETEGLKRRVRTLEKLIRRFDRTPGRRDDTDDTDDTSDTHTYTTEGPACTSQKLKRANTM